MGGLADRSGHGEVTGLGIEVHQGSLLRDHSSREEQSALPHRLLEVFNFGLQRFDFSQVFVL